MIEYIETGVTLLFLGILIASVERLRSEVKKLNKVAWINHPDDMKKD